MATKRFFPFTGSLNSPWTSPSETTTPESWNHRVALCLPEDGCAKNRRAVLTELGADTQALREQDRGASLFDLGLGALQVDVCVRAIDPPDGRCSNREIRL